MGKKGRGGEAGWAGPHRQLQHTGHGHVPSSSARHRAELPRPGFGWHDWATVSHAGQSTPSPHETVAASTPNLFRELLVNQNQTCLEFQRRLLAFSILARLFTIY